MASDSDESTSDSSESGKSHESVLLKPRDIGIKKTSVPPLEHDSYFKRFLHHDMVGSGFLLIAAVAAVVIANVGYAEQYHHFWETPFGFNIGARGEGWGFKKSLHHWVNDGLMAIFFFLVGLEIKREMRAGELHSVRKALLPVAAAVGGMVVPALKKWVPSSLMIFLVALAIVDDLGAVAVIALFYTEQIAFGPLIIGSSLIVLSFCLGQLGVRRTWPFVLMGIIIWFAFLQSGIHATIAGVLLAFTIPETARYHTHNFRGRMDELLGKFEEAEKHWDEDLNVVETELKDLMVNHSQQGLIRRINDECHFVESPLQRIEHRIEPFSVFIIMPIFAFANAGVHLEFGQMGEILKEPVTLGIIFGLFIGKPLGIVLASVLVVKLGFASLPRGVTWIQLTGVGFLAGIGFTMSLFVNELAFVGVDPEIAEQLMSSGKIAIFIASILSAVVGIVWLKLSCREVQR